ncbi:unnamed protein product [Aphanomyces euteiches]
MAIVDEQPNEIAENFTAIPDSPVVESVVEAKPRRVTRFRLAVAIAAVCGLVCVVVGAVFITKKHDKIDTKSIVNNIQQTPGLKVTVKALRSSMAINGKNEATVFIVPRTSENASSSLAFDAILTQEGENATATYVLLGNRGYWSISSGGIQTSAGCLYASQVPPVHLIQSSLEASREVDSVLVNGTAVPMNCETGQLLELQFAGETFVFCNSNANQLSHAKGTDLEITVEYLNDPTLVPDIAAPEVSTECAYIDTTLPTTARRLTAASASASTAATLSSSSCGCQGKVKPCLFVHGVGVKASSALTSTYSDYWGSIEKNAPCCSTTQFAHFDTVSRGWEDASLQQEFCNAALQVAANNQGKTVGDLILVTHSMANMFASSAVANNKCQFSTGVSWVSLSGPMQGSKSANLLVEKCTSGTWSDLALKGILDIVGYCPPQPAYLSLLHQSTVDSNTQSQFASIQSTRAQHVTKLVCGTSPIGLITIDSALEVVSALSHHDSANDGVVDINSCQAGYGTSGFGTSYSSSNYQASLNHLDTSFRNGDGWYGNDRKPVKWFECAL